MKKGRRGNLAYVMQDKTFVMGGFNKACGHVSEIECYNPFCDNWTIVEKADQNFFHFLVAM